MRPPPTDSHDPTAADTPPPRTPRTRHVRRVGRAIDLQRGQRFAHHPTVVAALAAFTRDPAGDRSTHGDDATRAGGSSWKFRFHWDYSNSPLQTGVTWLVWANQGGYAAMRW